MKIVVTGGGTGGHVFPALVLIQCLTAHEIVYAGSFKGFEMKASTAYGFRFFGIESRPLAGKKVFKSLLNLAVTAKGTLQALAFLFRFKPDVVVGTGGYVSFPVILAGWILRIPTLILEQNLLPGKTTRFLSRLASCVCVSFEESKKFLPEGKTRFTGNPVRPEIGSVEQKKACEELGVSAQLPVVLVMGASQGAKTINACLLKAIPYMQDKSWQILHLTGEAHYSSVLEEARNALSKTSLVYKPFPFADKMEIFYAAATLIISRAGATTIAEILAAGKPSILVPYPFAAENHQQINAEWLAEKRGCGVLLEEKLTPETFYQVLNEWLSNPEKLKEVGDRAKSLSHPDAAGKIISVLEKIAVAKSRG